VFCVLPGQRGAMVGVFPLHDRPNPNRPQLGCRHQTPRRVLNNDDCSGLPPAGPGILPAVGMSLVGLLSTLLGRAYDDIEDFGARWRSELTSETPDTLETQRNVSSTLSRIQKLRNDPPRRAA